MDSLAAKLRHSIYWTKPAPYLIVFLLVYITAFITLGEYLKSRAIAQWYQQAHRETQNLTTTSLNLLSGFHAHLKSIALLFHASEKVTEIEFLDAVDYFENRNMAAPISSLGVVQHKPENEYRIVISTDRIGPFTPGQPFGHYQVTRKIAEQCLEFPDQIVISNKFPSNDDPLVIFAISVPHNGENAILFMALNLQEHFKDLRALFNPVGLSFHLTKYPANNLSSEKGDQIVSDDSNTEPILKSYEFETETDGIHWKFQWNVHNNFLNGPKTVLGSIIQWGGSTIGLVIFAFMGRLSKENTLINKEVSIRTAELNETLKATREARNELDALTRIDPLTGLANRRSLDTYITEEWQRGMRFSRPIAVIMIDIDFFKNYNDTLGHSAGDDCLRRISSILKVEVSRSSDFVARYGGEEFLCLCPETDHEGAASVADKLLQAIAASNISHPTSSIADHVTVSIGTAVIIPSIESKPQNLIELADARLYKAKNSGRNQVCNET